MNHSTYSISRETETKRLHQVKFQIEREPYLAAEHVFYFVSSRAANDVETTGSSSVRRQKTHAGRCTNMERCAGPLPRLARFFSFSEPLASQSFCVTGRRPCLHPSDSAEKYIYNATVGPDYLHKSSLMYRQNLPDLHMT